MMHNLRANRKHIIGYSLAIVFSILIGIWIKRVPYVQLDPKLSIGEFSSSLIALIGLAAAVLFLPYIVNKTLSNRETRDSIIVKDLEEIYAQLREIEAVYKKLYDSKKKVTSDQRSELLHDLKIVSNLIKQMSVELQNDHSDMSFETEVKDIFNEETYKLLTENLQENLKIKPEDYLAASTSIIKLALKVKNCRYKTYQG